MSFEEELRRHLQARASGAKAVPDTGDLTARIRRYERRSARYERVALVAAVLVLAASLGGLGGALANHPGGRASSSLSSRYSQGAHDSPASTPATRPPAPAEQSARPAVAYSASYAGDVTVTASTQPFGGPVAVTGPSGTPSLCTTGQIVTTSVSEGGSFGGGTSVAELPGLEADGIEVLSSGVVQAAGAAGEWWVTIEVGSAVAHVGAENLGGTIVTATPAEGLAVIAGAISGTEAGSGLMSAVAESPAGDESLEFSLGSGPQAVDAVPAATNAEGCSMVSPPPQPSSAASSQPAEPALAAAAIVASFEQADSANPLLGFAANLAAVNSSERLSAIPTKSSGTRAASKGRGGGATSPVTSVPPGGPAGLAPIEVRQISFESASVAAVVYRFGGGILLTGEAVLGPGGSWRVSLHTFCANLRSGEVGGEVPPDVVAGCASQ